MTKDLGFDTLQKVTVFDKYAQYLPNYYRREVLEEIADRYKTMMQDRYPQLHDLIEEAIEDYVKAGKVLPSMRGMQFAGKAIEKNESRIYNCAFKHMKTVKAFSEIMFLLLGGTGVGFSVQKAHVRQLPPINRKFIRPEGEKTMKFLVGDSIEGWGDAVKALIESYFGMRKTKPRFDYSDIRKKGQRLVTAGGKAPGPEPLRRCLQNIELILDRKEDGDQLSPIEVHDIVCHIADAVLSGGIRRAALISLFSFDDIEMITAKSGPWWELNPQRGRANNSAVIVRDMITKEEFIDFWWLIRESGSGEPGMYFTNDPDWGTNPCAEIALQNNQFCNLTEVNVSDVESQEELEKRVMIASFFGTLQAGFTDFHYLDEDWITTTESERLIGVGMTGIASMNSDFDLYTTAQVAKDTNAMFAEELGFEPAARVTTVKPSGTTSCVLGTSSGIHSWYAPYYIRRIQVQKDSALYRYLAAEHPHLVQDYKAIANTAVIEIPIKAPEGSICRNDETALDMLDRVTKFNTEWVKQGHRDGVNTNNVSATVSIREDEWDIVAEWMWHNKHTFNGLSILPYDGGTYRQAPFEEITEEEYEKRYAELKPLEMHAVFEEEDNTDLSNELACFGSSCEIK